MQSTAVPELLYRQALAAARELLARIGDDDLTRPTPCAGWDLRALTGHMVGQNAGFAAAIDLGDAEPAAYAPYPVDRAADLLRAWDDSADRLLAACASAPPDRAVRLVEIAPDATFPVAAAVRFQLLDTVVHSWDVATALGIGYRPAPDELEVVAAVAERIPDGANRTAPGAAFGPSIVASTPDRWEATLARLGRQPRR